MCREGSSFLLSSGGVAAAPVFLGSPYSNEYRISSAITAQLEIIFHSPPPHETALCRLSHTTFREPVQWDALFLFVFSSGHARSPGPSHR